MSLLEKIPTSPPSSTISAAIYRALGEHLDRLVHRRGRLEVRDEASGDQAFAGVSARTRRGRRPRIIWPSTTAP